MRDVLPDPVFEAVQGHLQSGAEHAQTGWEAASEDEDTVTGDFGCSLRTGWKEINSAKGAWRWLVTYKKFRGRGRGAVEKTFCADGIVQVEAFSADGDLHTKGVLFQAKKASASQGQDMRNQVRLMESLAPGGSAVFEFGPEGYRAESGTIVIRDIGSIRERPLERARPIGRYLSDEFMTCQSGLRGMYFDAVRKVLLIPAHDTIKAVPLFLRHRLRIDIVHESQFESAKQGSGVKTA